VAAAEAGPAILVDALAISLGFGLLAVSRVPANRMLGLLVAAGLTSACLLTLAGEGWGSSSGSNGGGPEPLRDEISGPTPSRPWWRRPVDGLRRHAPRAAGRPRIDARFVAAHRRNEFRRSTS
jgi:hypothetical protein